jgi:hypothetical protein
MNLNVIHLILLVGVILFVKDFSIYITFSIALTVVVVIINFAVVIYIVAFNYPEHIEQVRRPFYSYVVIVSDKDIKCQICWEEIMSRKYIKPDPSVSSCVCTNFVVCESCFRKFDDIKCPFCRMILIV